MEALTYILPGGLVDEVGQIQREVEMRPLSGREEELLLTAAPRGAAAQVTAVLSCCIQRIGNVSSVSEDLIRQLLVGDRQFLMLKLRELTFGGRIQATVSCPWPACDTKVDIEFTISDIPIKAMGKVIPIYNEKFESGLTANDGVTTIWFRLPNGSDQEAVSPGLTGNQAVALTQLLHRCIQRIDGCESPSLEQIRDLPMSLRANIERKMQSLSPDVELTMEAACPECHREFTIPFDLQEFFFGEVSTSQELLRREIHYLAYHYHWSENDILAMARDRRREYINLIADEVESMNAGAQRSADG